MLQNVGLTRHEEQTYRLLVNLRTATLADLRRQLRFSAEEADLAFAGLVAKGLVSETTGSPRRLVATPPDVAGEALLLHRLEELQGARVEFLRLAEDYRESAGRPSIDGMIDVAPVEALPTLIEQLQRQATRAVWVVAMPPYVVPADQNPVVLERLAAGVEYRVLYTRSALDQPGALDMIRPYVAAGEQARMLPDLDLTMNIFDRKVAMLPAGRGRLDDPGDAIVVHESPLLDALVELFERLWLTAMPMAPMFDDPAELGGLSPGDSRLLLLLLAGLTDDAIGRHLGFARRTVVRRTHHLMERAKATNRLQLVWRATQLGWIQPSTAVHNGHGVRVP